MKGPMTSSTLPDISRDKLDGFRKMALAVIDDMHEAAVDMAGRHDHMVDLLKARVEEQDEQLAALVNQQVQWTRQLGAAIGEEHTTLRACVESTVDLIATLRHRIDEAQKQMSAIAADRGLVDVDVFRGDDGVIVVEIGCNDPVRITLADGTHLHGPVRVTPEFVETTKQEMLRSISEPLPGAARLAAVPPQQGPFVITMKVPQGRRFWGDGWVSDLARAYQYPDKDVVERCKPRRSDVVSVADARELIEAEKVVSITPPADAPTGPEAA